ncbi:hypothetical protein LX32DRAFT_641274 [Colletotrichum zoysiae]|uniref:Uncharacterized protein n=1 Tax=Colletotrichum zoysiae TaxID=1216348 RepID=A0AAD9HFN7_9PEZI|nr:hypothetical protein LX32DRAFT_641274 [Colletotrichum zoysiae]
MEPNITWKYPGSSPCALLACALRPANANLLLLPSKDIVDGHDIGHTSPTAFRSMRRLDRVLKDIRRRTEPRQFDVVAIPKTVFLIAGGAAIGGTRRGGLA